MLGVQAMSSLLLRARAAALPAVLRHATRGYAPKPAAKGGKDVKKPKTAAALRLRAFHFMNSSWCDSRRLNSSFHP